MTLTIILVISIAALVGWSFYSKTTKLIVIAIVLLVWMLVTFVLVCTLVGLAILIGDGCRTAWMELGLELKDALINTPNS